jgi:acetyl-CoA carboxylase biotin carboxylase subunit
MFKKVLVANRAEIACRVLRTLKKMGIASVAVYSDADKEAPHVALADEAVRVGPPQPILSYLNRQAIIDAAKQTGAEAIHPGYGFLSENADFAELCRQNGLTFIGPSPAALRAMGLKHEARAIIRKAGIPEVPGSDILPDADAAAVAAETIGYPVMLKASGGGGGIGMHRCHDEKQLRKAFEDAAKKAKMFFGDERVYLEKLIGEPHHIEIQIFGDGKGKIIHLFERECSIQRRNQKVIEETPSPFIDRALASKMGETAVKVAQAVDYANAGTVEFIVDGDRNFYFLEMNTRLQVEHGITELCTGIDLVEWMLLTAAGTPPKLEQEAIEHRGAAIECRLYAENPDKNFFPSPGLITKFVPPQGEGVRIDSGIKSNYLVTPFYDPLLAKLMAHGKDRAEAISRIKGALERTVVEGIVTNLQSHLRVVSSEAFARGITTTAFLQKEFGYKV